MINIKSWCYYDVIMNIFLFTSLRPCIFFANMHETRTNCELCRKNRILTNQNCPWMDLETVSRSLHTLYPWKKFFIIGSAHKVFFSSLKTWFYPGHLEFAQTCKYSTARGCLEIIETFTIISLRKIEKSLTILQASKPG